MSSEEASEANGPMLSSADNADNTEGRRLEGAGGNVGAREAVVRGAGAAMGGVRGRNPIGGRGAAEEDPVSPGEAAGGGP